MDQMTQQPILKMEINDHLFGTKHLVGGGEVRVCLVEVGSSRGLVATRIYHHGECRKWRLAKEINILVGTSCFILDLEVEFL
jgi:hypothetical protein